MSAKRAAARPHHGHSALPELLRDRERAELARRAYAAAFAGAESFRALNIGADLGYLIGAILTGGKVDWTPEGLGHDAPALLAILRAEFDADSKLWTHVILPADQPAEFKPGDFVAVVDLRDGAVVEPRTKITKIEQEEGRPVATLTAGFRVAVKCLRRVP